VSVGESSGLTRLVEGASVRLSCQVDANPRADVLWYRAGSGEIVSRSAELRLERVGRAQAGRYLCQANNSVGASQPAEVIVGVQCKTTFETVSLSLFGRHLCTVQC
jgi:hypothetical protein